MLNLRMTKGRKAFAAAFILLVALSTLFASLAFFTDRANKTTTIKVSTFNDDGYSIEQQAPAGWFVAGETLEVQIEESNEKEEPITSQITMRVVWDSPVDGVYPWANDDSAENAVITVDGEPISYSSDGDAITFTLPKTTLNANTSVETPLKFQIPSDLASTGRLYFTYEEIKLSQYPSGWTASYDGIDLSELSFDVGVVWNVSDNQSTKDVVAYLTNGATANDANYGLCIVRAGTDANTNKGLMMDWAAAGETPWADYSITELSIGEKVTTIGDYAFAGELGITSVTFPSTVTDIGVSAFDGAGLTGTLTIPATVQSIDSLAFGNLQAVTVISFGHSNTESLAMADPGKSSSGAFYAGYPYTPTSPLGTTILSDNDDILDYAWNMDARGYTVTVQNVTGATVVATPTTAIPGKSIALTAAADAGYEYIGCVVSWSSGNTTLAADELAFTMPAANVTVSPTVSLITYTIHYETNGGTLGNDAPTSYNVTTDTFALPEPTRAGYTFDGWYETSNFSGSEVTQIVKGTTGDQTFYAKWTANTDTPYTVYHWKQNLNGGDAQNDTNYTLADTDHLTGTTDTKVTPDRKIYIGFIAPSGTEITIGGDGTTELHYYYIRNSYTFTLGSCNGVSTSGSSPTGSYKYGATITLRSTTSVGYTWSQWISGNTGLVSNKTTANTTFTMPAGNISMTPSASLNSYSITYFPNGGTLPSDAVTSYTVESSAITLPTPTRTGYSFVGWYTSSDLSGTSVTQIVKGSTGDKIFYAKWTPRPDTRYTVHHWKQNLDGDDAQNERNFTCALTENLAGTTNTTVTPAVMDYTGFTAPTPQAVTIAADGSTVVNYYYTRNSYTFTLGSCSGVSTSGSTVSGSYRYESPITLEAVTQAGYTWVQWLSSDTSLINNLGMTSTEFNMPAGNITMTPSATLDSYTIDYELNGGTQGSGAVTSYTVESTVTLPTPTKTGYTFAGWYEDSNFSGSKVTQIAKGTTGNKMFYAKWTPNSDTTYTVNHYQQNLADDGYTLKETENKNGITGDSVTPATKTYEGFTSPSTQTVTIAADGSTVVNYYYTRNSYTFTLGSCAGVSTAGSSSTGSYKYGATITLKATANTGYTWAKWTSDTTLVSGSTTANTTFKMPAGSVTMTPSATLNTYTIEYELNGGTQGSGAVTSYNVTTATFSLPKPTKTGYTFAGWYENSGLTGTAVTQIAQGSTGNKTFYAKWTANTNTAYTVKHYQQNITDDGYTLKEIENKSGITGQSVTPAVKTYTGFTSPSTQTVTIAADGSTVVNYYYTRNSYTFTLGSGTGVSTTGSSSTGSYKYGATITLKATASTGYTWNTWTSGNTSLVASTSTANTTFTMPAGNITMTPSATLNTYTISYVLNGGTQGSGAVENYNVTTATFSLPTPTKTGYTFGGWYENSDFSGTAVTQITKGSTGNKTYYAKWTKLPPVLAEMYYWYSQGDTDIEKANVVSITFVDEIDDATAAAAGDNVWDASDDKVGTVHAYLVETGTDTGLYDLTIAGNGYGKIYANANSKRAFLEFTSVTTINNADLLDTCNATTMEGMFSDCNALEKAPDTSSWDTSHVTAMSSMFGNCYAMATPPDTSNWDTSLVENMSGMFSSCKAMASPPDTSNWDTSLVENMSAMFYCCRAMTSPPNTTNWNTTKVTQMYDLFNSCSSMAAPPVTTNWDVSLVQSMALMFNSCKAMASPPDTSNWKPTNLTSTSWMFCACSSMTTAPNTTNWTTPVLSNVSSMFMSCSSMTTPPDTSKWTTSSFTNMDNMFNACYAMVSAPVMTSWDTSNVTSMFQTFMRCDSIPSLDVSSFDTSSITDSSNLRGFAHRCYNLTTIVLGPNFGQSYNIPEPGKDSSVSPGIIGMFFVDGYNKANPLRTTVTGANDLMLAYDWSEDLRGFVVDVATAAGGTLTTDKDPAINGATVTLTVTTNDGYSYGGATVSYTLNGTAKTITLDPNTTSFIMPAADVTITPVWNIDGEAFAIFCETDGSLTFYFDVMPSVGDTYNGKTVTAVYTGYETDLYQTASAVPWIDVITEIKSVSFQTTVKPRYTQYWFSGATNLTSFDQTNLDTSATKTMTYMFYHCTSLTSLDITALDTSSCFDFESMFNGCTSLSSIDVSNFNMSAALRICYMFYDCSSLTSLDLSAWNSGSSNTSKVYDMSYLVRGCTALQSIALTNMDTSSVTNVDSMFAYCSSLKSVDVSSFTTNKMTSMQFMFASCTSLTSLDLSAWNSGSSNTSSVTLFNDMFSGCTGLITLDLTNFNTSSATSFSNTFRNCHALTEVDVSSFTAANVKKANFMFYSCYALTELDLSSFNTGSVLTEASDMFSLCESLETLDLSSFDTSSVTCMERMFQGMDSLKQITLGSNFVFLDATSYLPVPSITGADGLWYNTTTGVGYSPAELAAAHGGTTVTYSAIAPSTVSTASVSVPIDSSDALLTLTQTVEDTDRYTNAELSPVVLTPGSLVSDLDEAEFTLPVIEIPVLPTVTINTE